MKRKIHAAIIATALTIILASAAYASLQFMVHQNLTIPPNHAIAVYQSDGVTSISNGQDITSCWGWTGTQFMDTMIIKNVGNLVITPTFTLPKITGWTLSVLGNGTIGIGKNETVTLVAIPSNMTAGVTTGDFDIYINY